MDPLIQKCKSSLNTRHLIGRFELIVSSILVELQVCGFETVVPYRTEPGFSVKASSLKVRSTGLLTPIKLFNVFF